ncbi:MAG TPA: hypothetical protein VHO71_06620 [Caproiciproducens sp.]|nr:hypothetical protein [Caproiciproducens sp.]
MKLGEFYNMLVVDDWCAIRYKVHITHKKTGEKIEWKSQIALKEYHLFQDCFTRTRI